MKNGGGSAGKGAIDYIEATFTVKASEPSKNLAIKTYEKTYFLPEKPTGILSKVEGETKQRNSRIKIVIEGNKDKFGIGSNIEDSSE